MEDGVRAEILDAEGRHETGGLLRGDEAGKRSPEPVERSIGEETGCAPGALALPSCRREHERQRPDQMRRDVGSQYVALPQSGTYEPDAARSQVAKPTVDETRGSARGGPAKVPGIYERHPQPGP